VNATAKCSGPVLVAHPIDQTALAGWSLKTLMSLGELLKHPAQSPGGSPPGMTGSGTGGSRILLSRSTGKRGRKGKQPISLLFWPRTDRSPVVAHLYYGDVSDGRRCGGQARDGGGVEVNGSPEAPRFDTGGPVRRNRRLAFCRPRKQTLPTCRPASAASGMKKKKSIPPFVVTGEPVGLW